MCNAPERSESGRLTAEGIIPCNTSSGSRTSIKYAFFAELKKRCEVNGERSTHFARLLGPVLHFLVRENWCNPILLQFLFLFIEGPFLFWSLRRVESSSKYYNRPGDPDAVAWGGQGYEPGAGTEHFERCNVIITPAKDRL